MMMMMVAVLIVTAATIFSSSMLSKLGKRSTQSTTTVNNIETVRKSLLNFVTQNGYLPCPANGAASTGLSVPARSVQTCTNANGTVPWASLGIDKSVALDGWSNKISYRVYQGPTGLTQANGANMTDCDIAPPQPAAPSAPNRLCRANNSTSGHPGELNGFLSPIYRPGFSVSDIGVVNSQIGMVLISHGETGQGAWTNSGGRLALPTAAGELSNTRAAATQQFTRLVRTDSSVPTTNALHFDDEVVYMTIADIINQAKRGPRKWATVTPLATPISVTTDASALTTSGGITFTGQSSGVSVVDVPSTPTGPGATKFMVISTALGSLISKNLAGTALGVCPPTATAACSVGNAPIQSGEYLSFLLTQNIAGKVDVGFENVVGTVSAQVIFKSNGVVVGKTVPVKVNTLPGQPSPVATVSPDYIADWPLKPDSFDEVVVTAVGTGSFFIKSVQFFPPDIIISTPSGVVAKTAAGDGMGVCPVVLPPPAAPSCDDAAVAMTLSEELSFKLTGTISPAVAQRMAFQFNNKQGTPAVQARFSFFNAGVEVAGSPIVVNIPKTPVLPTPPIVFNVPTAAPLPGVLPAFDEVRVTALAPGAATAKLMVQHLKFCNNAPPLSCL